MLLAASPASRRRSGSSTRAHRCGGIRPACAAGGTARAPRRRCSRAWRGTITLALGEPPELVELPAGSFARVGTGTEIQVRHESDAEAVVLAWGAPAITGEAEILDDLP